MLPPKVLLNLGDRCEPAFSYPAGDVALRVSLLEVAGESDFSL